MAARLVRRTAPVLLAWGGLTLACGRGAPREELVVYAAASLRDALGEAARAFELAGGSRVVFNFGSSGDLARQILAGDQADLFFSADEQELERVVAAGLVAPESVVALLSNQLVVIEPADGGTAVFQEPFDPSQLAGAGVELLSLARTETVPAGKYARAWLEAQGLWSLLEPRVLPAVDVRAALAAVECGAARAGIVYRTDAARSARVRIVHAVPPGEGPRITYTLALLARRPARARALSAFLAADEARAIFERHGFLLPGKTP